MSNRRRTRRSGGVVEATAAPAPAAPDPRATDAQPHATQSPTMDLLCLPVDVMLVHIATRLKPRDALSLSHSCSSLRKALRGSIVYNLKDSARFATDASFREAVCAVIPKNRIAVRIQCEDVVLIPDARHKSFIGMTDFEETLAEGDDDDPYGTSGAYYSNYGKSKPTLDVSGLAGTHSVALHGFTLVGLSSLADVAHVDMAMSLPAKIEDLSHLGRARSLVLDGVDVVDVTAFAGVSSLSLRACLNLKDVSALARARSLNLDLCVGISDVSALGGVRKLSLRGCSAVSAVSMLGGVRELHLDDCYRVSDVSGLAGVDTLSLRGCANVKDVSSLGSVRRLYLDDCAVSDVSALAGVHTLSLRCCKNVVDVSMLGSIRMLCLDGCTNVKDVSALGRVHTLSLRMTRAKGYEALKGVHALSLNGVPIKNVAPFANVHTLDISGTKVKNVSALKSVHTLSIRATRVSDVSALGGVTNLQLGGTGVAQSLVKVGAASLLTVKRVDVWSLLKQPQGEYFAAFADSIAAGVEDEAFLLERFAALSYIVECQGSNLTAVDELRRMPALVATAIVRHQESLPFVHESTRVLATLLSDLAHRRSTDSFSVFMGARRPPSALRAPFDFTGVAQAVHAILGVCERGAPSKVFLNAARVVNFLLMLANDNETGKKELVALVRLLGATLARLRAARMEVHLGTYSAICDAVYHCAESDAVRPSLIDAGAVDMVATALRECKEYIDVRDAAFQTALLLSKSFPEGNPTLCDACVAALRVFRRVDDKRVATGIAAVYSTMPRDKRHPMVPGGPDKQEDPDEVEDWIYLLRAVAVGVNFLEDPHLVRLCCVQADLKMFGPLEHPDVVAVFARAAVAAHPSYPAVTCAAFAMMESVLDRGRNRRETLRALKLRGCPLSAVSYLLSRPKEARVLDNIDPWTTEHAVGNALAFLAHFSAYGAEDVRRMCRDHMSNEAIDAVCRAMNTYRDSQRVQVYGLCLLCRLVMAEEGAWEAILAFAHETVVNAMQKFPTDDRIASHACLALSRMGARDVNAQMAEEGTDYVGAIAKCMHDGAPPETWHTAHCALYRIATQGHFELFFERPDAVKLLLEGVPNRAPPPRDYDDDDFLTPPHSRLAFPLPVRAGADPSGAEYDAPLQDTHYMPAARFHEPFFSPFDLECRCMACARAMQATTATTAEYEPVRPSDDYGLKLPWRFAPHNIACHDRDHPWSLKRTLAEDKAARELWGEECDDGDECEGCDRCLECDDGDECEGCNRCLEEDDGDLSGDDEDEDDDDDDEEEDEEEDGQFPRTESVRLCNAILALANLARYDEGRKAAMDAGVARSVCEALSRTYNMDDGVDYGLFDPDDCMRDGYVYLFRMLLRGLDSATARTTCDDLLGPSGRECFREGLEEEVKKGGKDAEAALKTASAVARASPARALELFREGLFDVIVAMRGGANPDADAYAASTTLLRRVADSGGRKEMLRMVTKSLSTNEWTAKAYLDVVPVIYHADVKETAPNRDVDLCATAIVGALRVACDLFYADRMRAGVSALHALIRRGEANTDKLARQEAMRVMARVLLRWSQDASVTTMCYDILSELEVGKDQSAGAAILKTPGLLRVMATHLRKSPDDARLARTVCMLLDGAVRLCPLENVSALDIKDIREIFAAAEKFAKNDHDLMWSGVYVDRWLRGVDISEGEDEDEDEEQ